MPSEAAVAAVFASRISVIMAMVGRIIESRSLLQLIFSPQEKICWADSKNDGPAHSILKGGAGVETRS